MKKYIIGIDIGGSTTKIAGLLDGKVVGCLLVKASDPVASLYGAFGKFLAENHILLEEVASVCTTGVGSSFVSNNIYGIDTTRVSEFESIGRGGLFLSKLPEAIIVSMGTGTALVHAKGVKIQHIGGTGVGGGTLIGLSSAILNVRDFENLVTLAEHGDLNKIDLTIEDITTNVVSNLPQTATASNFGKLSELVEPGDIALGLLNLVVQTIGVMGVFAASAVQCKDIVLTGTLSEIPKCKELFHALNQLYPVHFVFPDKSKFATAIGAALSSPDTASQSA